MAKQGVVKRSSQRRDEPVRAKGLPAMLWVGVGGLLLLLVGLMLALRPGAAPATELLPGPRVAVDQQEIDFGEVPVEKMVRAEFEITNAGDEPLQIIGEPLVEAREGC